MKSSSGKESNDKSSGNSITTESTKISEYNDSSDSPKKGRTENIYVNSINDRIINNDKVSNKSTSSDKIKPPICLVLQ